MHIFQLSDFYRPVIGGLERHVETLSRELVGCGHKVTVVTLQTSHDPPEETLDGVRVVRIRGWSGALASVYANAAQPFHPTFPDPGAVAVLRRMIATEHPDVVHNHSWLQYSYFPLHRSQQSPAHVVTLHDHGLACARKTLQQAGHSSCSGPGLAKCLACAPGQYGVLKGTVITAGLRASRVLHKRADRYIAISSAVAEGARPALPDGTEITVIPTMVPDNLADLAKLTPRPPFLPSEDGYLMFAGALGRHKGVDVLLDAWRRMRHRPPLVLIGTSRSDTPPLDDPGLVVVRDVPSAQVMASWIRASVAVVPSVWNEPQGQAAIEATLLGRPVVASDAGGLRDVVQHGVTGVLVPPGDPEALAGALDRLLDDPAMRRRMGEAGRRHARQFQAVEVTARILEVFEEVRLRRPGPAQLTT